MRGPIYWYWWCLRNMVHYYGIEWLFRKAHAFATNRLHAIDAWLDRKPMRHTTLPTRESDIDPNYHHWDHFHYAIVDWQGRVELERQNKRSEYNRAVIEAHRAYRKKTRHW